MECEREGTSKARGCPGTPQYLGIRDNRKEDLTKMTEKQQLGR